MAIEVKTIFVVCIWLTLAVYSQTITVRPHDYEQLSKAVDKFLDILMEETNKDDDKINYWETFLDEDINPKLAFLAHALRIPPEDQLDMTSLGGHVRSTGDELVIPEYLQALLSARDQPSQEQLLSSGLPLSQPYEINPINIENGMNTPWGGSSATDSNIIDDVIFSDRAEKRNGIWFGKRSSGLDDLELSKRNGIWFGKRTTGSNEEEKRNGIWYGKRNGIWYGKRNGIWFGKRNDQGHYPGQVL